MSECAALGEQVPRLMDAATAAAARPGPANHLDLICSADSFLQVYSSAQPARPSHFNY
jgi:hypothetical protein